jgi:hypothetical protein
MRKQIDRERVPLDALLKKHGVTKETLARVRASAADWCADDPRGSAANVINDVSRSGEAAALPLLSGSLVLVAPRQTLSRLARWLHLDPKQVSKMHGDELILSLHDRIRADVRENDTSSVPLLSGWFALLMPGRALLAFPVSLERDDDDRDGSKTHGDQGFGQE